MQDILTCVMGLDVHRDIIVACLVKGAVDAEPEAETRTFSTLIPEMQKLRDWVIESECRNIAMESTGIYWQPIYEMLESCFDGEVSILVVNARHMKNVPGRKTDMKDAQWIATLLRAGLLKGSFIPDKTFRELRHLTRYRKSVVHDITAQKNRIDKFLQSSGFRFTAFLSDTFGASGRNIIRHLIEHGSIDREALDKCLKTKTRNRIDEILVALNGSLSVHQRRFLNIVFLHLEDLEAHKHTVEDEITEEEEPLSRQETVDNLAIRDNSQGKYLALGDYSVIPITEEMTNTISFLKAHGLYEKLSDESPIVSARIADMGKATSSDDMRHGFAYSSPIFNSFWDDGKSKPYSKKDSDGYEYEVSSYTSGDFMPKDAVTITNKTIVEKLAANAYGLSLIHI